MFYFFVHFQPASCSYQLSPIYSLLFLLYENVETCELYVLW